MKVNFILIFFGIIKKKTLFENLERNKNRSLWTEEAFGTKGEIIFFNIQTGLRVCVCVCVDLYSWGYS